MPHSRFPRVTGFEVPPLKVEVDTLHDAPIVALLDVIPSADWVETFDGEVDRLVGGLGTAEVSIDGERLFFFGSKADGRQLSDAIRALVERVNALHMGERFDAARRGSPEEEDRGEVSQPPSGRRVLVVEDEAVLRMVACDVLTEAGWMPVPAANGDEALAILAADPAFDAVFTDVDMPGSINGIGLSQTIANRWPGMGMVVTSGRYTTDASMLPGGAAFLSKPYQRRQLVLLLDMVTRTPTVVPG